MSLRLVDLRFAPFSESTFPQHSELISAFIIAFTVTVCSVYSRSDRRCNRERVESSQNPVQHKVDKPQVHPLPRMSLVLCPCRDMDSGLDTGFIGTVMATLALIASETAEKIINLDK